MTRFGIMISTLLMTGTLQAQQALPSFGHLDDLVPGNIQNAQAVSRLWDAWVKADFSAEAAYYADTITMYQADGTIVHDSRQNIIAENKKLRAEYSNVESKLHSCVALRTKDNREFFVYVWGTDSSIDKKGRKEVVDLFEIWSFNKEGKAYEMHEFTAKPAHK